MTAAAAAAAADKENVVPPPEQHGGAASSGASHDLRHRETRKTTMKKKKKTCCRHRRTPLRDITAFVNEMDRRRIAAVRIIAALQRNRSAADALQQEQGAPEGTEASLQPPESLPVKVPAPVKLGKRSTANLSDAGSVFAEKTKQDTNDPEETMRKLKRRRTLMSLR